MNDAGNDAGSSRARAWTLAALVFALAAAVYAMGGNKGRLFHDDGIFLYGGQAMVRGTPVYLGMFDHKGPLGQMVCGLGVWLAQLVGKDDLITTRYLFLAIASATAAGTCLLGATLFRSRVHGFLAGAIFVSFWGYGSLAFSGTRPKMLMTLFQVAGLLLIVRRRWFLAGVATTLAAFTWQPTGIYFLVALLLAWFQSENRRTRTRALLALVLGGAVPTAAMCAYFLAEGAFGAFVDGCFLFNLRFLENRGTWSDQVRSFLAILVHSGMGAVTLVGLCTIPALYAWRVRELGARALVSDRFAALLLSFPFPVLWSLHDFQQYPDFFIFLPYLSVALAWVAHAAASGLGDALRLEGRARTAWTALPGLLLAAFSGVALRHARNDGLHRQWGFVREFEAEYGDARVAVVGVPEALALLRRPNVTRYGFVMRGIASYIDANEPGGFEGWLESIRDAKPDVLIADEDYPERLGSHAEAWTRWLATWERRPEPIGPWSVFLPRDEAADGQ